MKTPQKEENKAYLHFFLSSGNSTLTGQFPTKFPLLVDYVACLLFCLGFFGSTGVVKKFSHILI